MLTKVADIVSLLFFSFWTLNIGISFVLRPDDGPAIMSWIGAICIPLVGLIVTCEVMDLHRELRRIRGE